MLNYFNISIYIITASILLKMFTQKSRTLFSFQKHPKMEHKHITILNHSTDFLKKITRKARDYIKRKIIIILMC